MSNINLGLISNLHLLIIKCEGFIMYALIFVKYLNHFVQL